MIIQCESCSRKFIVKDTNIPASGRNVQCGYCSVIWHQMPVGIVIKENKPDTKVKNYFSASVVKASDDKTYKFLGNQWAQLLPSGKTGIFAKKKIARELDKLTGKNTERVHRKKINKKKKKLNPSSENGNTLKTLPDIYQSKKGLGFFGYTLLIITLGFAVVGVLITFEDTLLNYFPQSQYIFEILDQQLIFLEESVKNIIVLANDLINSY